MAKEVAGVPLGEFEAPIHDSLRTYQAMANGGLQFDLSAARLLELTPDKPNSARSVTEVQHLGETIGKLVVIAFAPQDGTGDESLYVAEYTSVDRRLPKQAKVMPRSKEGVHSEIHLALAAKFVESKSELTPFAGCLELIGFKDDGIVGVIGGLGQGQSRFVDALELGYDVKPTASLTVGQDLMDRRAGDPHAVYNQFELVVQVGGFLAITNEMAERHASLVQELGARVRY